jgi:hypothetical protein
MPVRIIGKGTDSQERQLGLRHEPMVFAGRLSCSRTGFPNVRFWFASRRSSIVPTSSHAACRGVPVVRALSIVFDVMFLPSLAILMLAPDEFALLPAFFVLIGIILEATLLRRFKRSQWPYLHSDRRRPVAQVAPNSANAARPAGALIKINPTVSSHTLGHTSDSTLAMRGVPMAVSAEQLALDMIFGTDR